MANGGSKIIDIAEFNKVAPPDGHVPAHVLAQQGGAYKDIDAQIGPAMETLHFNPRR